MKKIGRRLNLIFSFDLLKMREGRPIFLRNFIIVRSAGGGPIKHLESGVYDRFVC